MRKVVFGIFMVLYALSIVGGLVGRDIANRYSFLMLGLQVVALFALGFALALIRR